MVLAIGPTVNSIVLNYVQISLCLSGSTRSVLTTTAIGLFQYLLKTCAQQRMKALHKMKGPSTLPTKSRSSIIPALSELKQRIKLSALGLHGYEGRTSLHLSEGKMSLNDSNNSIYGDFSYFDRPKTKSTKDILTRWEPLDAPYQRPHTDNSDQSMYERKTLFRRNGLADSHPDENPCVSNNDDSTVDFSDVDNGCATSDGSTSDELPTETITYSTHPNDPPIQPSRDG